MPSEGDTFLPRIQSVFYAIFDVKQGPKVVYQVPEALISTSQGPAHSELSSAVHTPDTDDSYIFGPSFVAPPAQSRTGRPSLSPSRNNRVLFHFDDISKYVIPPSALCGRLVICATGNYRIIGFPVALLGNYERNYFRYNVCFVFERTADLSCYEPIVRKVSRVLTTCEEESTFLSSSQSSTAMHAILEQLYEDLNSYSETSIQIDLFNSIELKIFPFYPNPPPVKDWMVPVSLINLSKRVDENWDLTMNKVCQYIDGVNHVKRISQLADCGLELTRQAISHLLYYQVIMVIDIFQYCNMYTLRKSVQWLADAPHVKEECGAYVTKSGREVPDWPRLLHLYSRLKPGKTVFEWMEEYNVAELGIDIRRFVSFGVIKGFLRRVHRWPVLTQSDTPSPRVRRRRLSGSSPNPATPVNSANISQTNRASGRISDVPSNIISIMPEAMLSSPTKDIDELDFSHSSRRTSAAERVLERLHNKAVQQSSSTITPLRIELDAPDISPRRGHATLEPRLRNSYSQSKPLAVAPSLAPAGPQSIPAGHAEISAISRPRLSRSPSTPSIQLYTPSIPFHHTDTKNGPLVPPQGLAKYLDGEHHTDELSTIFEAGWPMLQQWLTVIGGGDGNGDFGKVLIIYR